MKRMDPEVLAMLEASGLAWEVRPKRRHYALLIQGRVVAMLSHSPRDVGCHVKNLRACVRKAIEKEKTTCGCA